MTAATGTFTARIWVVEDDEACREIIEEALAGRWPLRAFGTIRELEQAAREAGDDLPSLVIADVCLPDANFVSWARSEPARRLFRRVPVLVVSSLDEADMIRSAFEGGAIDFVSKPFRRAELVVKVERAMAIPPERALGSPQAEFELDATAMVVRRGAAAAALTSKEMQIVAALARSPAHTCTRDELRKAVWRDLHVGRKTLDVHLSRIRRKLAAVGLDVRAQTSGEVVLVVG